MKDEIEQIANDAMRAAQLAAALDVSGWPKPGNVHRLADFTDTRFEHFLAGSIALGPSVREAALQGIKAGLGEIELSEIEIGKYVKEAICEVKRWHKGGNTHLGIILLFMPLAVASGMACIQMKRIEPRPLRERLSNIMKATTAQDAINVYDAINLASSAALGRLNRQGAPDLSDVSAKTKLAERRITLYDAMKTSSKWDNIAKEWTTGMEICFETGYPTLMKVHKETHDINMAVVHTFLTILSGFPDTFIARKVGTRETPYIEKAVEIGIQKTRWISETAGEILKMGGLTTKLGREALFDFDRKLQSAGGEHNPGTSADLTAGSLMIGLLCGFRF